MCGVSTTLSRSASPGANSGSRSKTSNPAPQIRPDRSASTSAELDRDGAEKLLRLVDVLEDLDDVQEVYNNADISDEIMASLDN